METIIIGVMDSNIGGINRFIIDYIKLNNQKYNFVILTNGDIQDAYKKEIKPNTIIEQISSITNPFKLYRISCKIFKDIQPSCVYLNISTNLFYPIIKAAFDCGIKERIVHSHSSYSADESLFKRIIIVLLNNLLKNKMNKLATQKKACSDIAAKWLFGEKVEYQFIYNKIDGHKFEFSKIVRERIRKELNIEKSLIIGYVGGFNYQKKIEWFIELAIKLKKYRKDFFILMLGDGIRIKNFEQKLKQKKLEKNFILLGNKSNANEYYNVFDCFVLPSRFEGLPIVGVEAQVNGLPCFFSDTITKQVQITKNCVFFNNRKYEIINDLVDLNIRNDIGGNPPLENYKDFIY